MRHDQEFRFFFYGIFYKMPPTIGRKAARLDFRILFKQEVIEEINEDQAVGNSPWKKIGRRGYSKSHPEILPGRRK
jgi:hypothetical protein